MNLTIRAAFIMLLLWAGTVQPAATLSDTAKEARWAEQIVGSLLDGEAVWLDDGQGHEFLGIYTPAGDAGGRAVILMHGVGVHPNWPDVIYPLRAGLLEQGITTLSIQMPVLANDAETESYIPLVDESPRRIEAAIEYLRGQGYAKITPVGHSLGASMATQYLAANSPDGVDSLVVIGMNPGITGFRNLRALEKIRVPVLDLYGSEDQQWVLNFTGDRERAGRMGGDRQYRQIEVPGANHFFQGYEDELLRHVGDWIEAR